MANVCVSEYIFAGLSVMAIKYHLVFTRNYEMQGIFIDFKFSPDYSGRNTVCLP